MPLDKYYKILDLPSTASKEEIRRRYRKLAMKYHPDKNVQSGAKEQFIAITEAYEILIGKKEVTQETTQTKAKTKTEKEKRAKEARQRHKEQILREYLENEYYYRELTSGKRWQIFRVSAIFCTILAIGLLIETVLPFHYDEDRVVSYSLNSAHAPGGEQLSLIKTEKNDYYWISTITYELYSRYPQILIEKSWLFHNSVRIISRKKTGYTSFKIHFNVHSMRFIAIPLFLVPLLTIYYKRKNIYFTLLYHFSFYIVNAVMLFFIFTGDRWAHLLTLGFL